MKRTPAAAATASAIAIAFAITLLLTSSCRSPSNAPQRPHAYPATLEGLCQEFWKYLLDEDPIQASRLGYRSYDALLPSLGPADFAARHERLGQMQDRLRALRSNEKANRRSEGKRSEEDLITLDVLSREFRLRRRAIDLHLEEREINQMYGPQIWIWQLAESPIPDADACRDFLHRLDALHLYMRQYLACLERGLERGNHVAAVVVRRVVGQIDDALAQKQELSPLMQVAQKIPETLSPAVRSSFLQGLKERVRDSVYPELNRMRDYLANEYLPELEEAIGLSSSTGGSRCYEFLIERYTDLELGADAIHERGLQELETWLTRMREVAKKLGHEGSLASYHAKLRKDPKFGYQSREKLLRAAEKQLARAKRMLRPRFRSLPLRDCTVRSIESFREKDAPPAYYGPVSKPGLPAVFWINTHAPELRNRSNLAALTLHEAVPGHHTQIALAQELTELPRFRRELRSTAFTEGWALYAETLGEEADYYRDDRELYGMLAYQAWRAARLVVDTGIHAFGWTRDRAIRFLEARLPLSSQAIENEVDRYIMWPGQALAYMVGKQEILALRRRAHQILKDRFDIQSFHTTVLSHGAVPLPVLQKLIERWIDRQR